MEFGQRICTARPRCGECPARIGCPAVAAVENGAATDGVDPGADPAPRVRRQAPYRGSLRERRGRLLARVLAAGEIALAEADPEAAAGLLADGLLVRCDGALRAEDQSLSP